MNILHASEVHGSKEEVSFDGSITFGVVVPRNEAKEAQGGATILGLG